MCFSAMVEQNAKVYGLRYKARVQTDLYDDLFARRLSGEKLYINKAMEQQFTHGADVADARIKKNILEWHEEQISKLEAELFKQKKRLNDAERKLKEKETKKAHEDLRISSSKIDKIKVDLERHRTTEVSTEIEQRIFPLHYMSMLCLDENDQKVVRPVRYLMRPHNKDASFDFKFNGCYNARYDSLTTVPWWKDSMQKRHGLILVRKFYENVATEDYVKLVKAQKPDLTQKNLVLCFEPDGIEYMCIPTLWDEAKDAAGGKLLSAALITDEPLPEIAAAGHDRTPIFLKEDAIDEWLFAIRKSADHAKLALQNRERPHYSHRITEVA